MSSDVRPRPPAPIIAATALTGLVAAVFLVGAITLVIRALTDGDPSVPLVALWRGLLFLFIGSVSHGIWRGWRGSRLVAIAVVLMVWGSSVQEPAVAALSAPWGLAIIVLLLAPRSARAWFAVRR